jgi:hypothetical protein
MEELSFHSMDFESRALFISSSPRRPPAPMGLTGFGSPISSCPDQNTARADGKSRLDSQHPDPVRLSRSSIVKQVPIGRRLLSKGLT